MTANIIDGKKIAQQLRQQVAENITRLKKSNQFTPGLAVVMVGSDPASQVYVRNKRNACEEVGIHSKAFDLPASTSEQALLNLIEELNADPEVDGILVQFPLPSQINSDKVIETIRPDKDVDGFHPYNIGRLAVRKPTLRSCTPFGVIKLLESIDEIFYGREAVVVGASNHVGRPMVLELLLAGSTVTTCHRFTRDLQKWVGRADILVVATGKQGLVKGEWIKEGATVIDIGIHRTTEGSLTGDVDFKTASEKAAWITPVPGGVGPMTVASLMLNTVQAACIRRDIPDCRDTFEQKQPPAAFEV